MHGIVNQAIQGLVIENFGSDKWEQIKQLSGVTQDYFISDEAYEDNITFELVGAAAEVLNIPAEQILQSFGEYWVLKTGYERYGDLMKAGGENFYEFICNLPNFHGRIMLIYPNLTPPEFITEKISDTELLLHYYSSRAGLTDFVVGLLQGLAKMFNESIEIQWKNVSSEQVWHDVFTIKLNQA